MGGKGCHGEHTSFGEVKLKRNVHKVLSAHGFFSGNEECFFSHDILVWWKDIDRVGHRHLKF